MTSSTPWSPWHGAIHCVGIGGAGMSSAARLLAARGLRVTGSDGAPGAAVRALREAGIPVALGHRAEHLPAEATGVIRSLAVPDDNPEVAAARARGLPVWSYPELVGRLMAEKVGVAVAGTHGKTSTAAMLAHVLCAAGADPSVLVGGECASIGGGGRAGRGDHFVAEACEFQRAFLNLRPRCAVLTSVEPDHFDCYADRRALEDAFAEFVALLPRNGVLVANADDVGAMRTVVRAAACRVVTYGLDTPAAVRAQLVESRPRGHVIALSDGARPIGTVALPQPGRHVAQNAAGAAAAALALGVAPGAIGAGLATFPGVARRFQIVGEGGGVTVVDDYAHHPTAVRVVIAAARQRFPLRRLLVVFQPHQGSRTRHLLPEFAAALAQADQVLLPEIYYAREGAEERRRISSLRLAGAVKRLGVPAAYLGDVSRLTAHVVPACRPGDVVLVMGAGDIAGQAQRLVGALRARALAASGLPRLAGEPWQCDARGIGRVTPSGQFEAVA